jgi:hypothetical protein
MPRPTTKTTKKLTEAIQSHLIERFSTAVLGGPR